MNRLVWLIISAVLILLLTAPVYIHVCYDGCFTVSLRILFIKLTLLPKRKKKKRHDEQSKSESEKASTDGKKLLSQLHDIKTAALSLLKHLPRAFFAKRLVLDISVGTDDPCDTAILFGAVNASVYSAVEAVSHYVTVGKRQISVKADYNSEKTSVCADVLLKTFLFKLLHSLISAAVDVIIKRKEEND